MPFEHYCSLDHGSWARGALGALAGALLLQSACASDTGESVQGRVVLVDQSAQALTLAQLVAANGTYTNCSSHVDGASWSLAITGGTPGALTNPVLTVILNDAACDLTLTELVKDGTPDVTMTASTPIPLGASYAALNAASFGVAPLEFYANALINPADYSANFVVTILFSDNPRLATDMVEADFAVATSTATATGVTAPNNTLDLSTFVVMTDFNDVVTSVSGAAVLNAGSTPGQFYVLIEDSGLTAYDEIETAYLGGGMPIAVPASIAAAAFTLVGTDLGVSEVRTLIISNTVNGVTSYQVFEISFNAAP